MKYVSLIMDIEKSKTYPAKERMELQEFMVLCIDKLNIMFENDMKFKVTFSAGDELQGLFYDITTAVMYFRLFELLIKPVKIRAGIGVGELTVEFDDGPSTMQDGPAYYCAKEAINDVYKSQFHNLKIYSNKNETDILANHLLNASITLKRQQLYMQNIVLIILEFLCPFIKKQVIKNNYEEVYNLLERKLNYSIGKKKSAYGTTKEDKYNTIINFSEDDYRWLINLNAIKINGKINDAEDYIIKRNINTFIADILGCSRQNVDSIIQRGAANKIRELDYVALQYIEKEYGDKLW